MFTSLHFTSLHFTSLHFTSLQIFHFPPILEISSPRFKNLSLLLTYNLFHNPLSKNMRVTVASASVVSWFIILLSYLQTTTYRYLFFVSCLWFNRFRQHGPWNLSPIALHAPSAVYALKRAQMRAIFLLCAKISHTESFVWLANLASFFCTRSNEFIWPSLYEPQHQAPYSRIGSTNDV